MNQIPEPTDPLVRLEISRDPWLMALWAEFSRQQAARGVDPNKPPPYMTSFRDFANSRVDPILRGAGRAQYEGWKRAGESELAVRAEERKETTARVSRWWRVPLDLLDQLLSVAEEFGLFHVQRFMEAPGQFPRTYPLLIHLHSRGVQVAEETLALLQAGFAAGAEGRWRTLHETAVVAAFISKHGADTAERYVEHDHVRVKKAMDSEQEHHEQLGLQPYTEKEMEEAQTEFEALKQKYGRVFVKDYGWAAAALGISPDSRQGPTFFDIEASLNLRVFRAAYKSASQAIHAGPGALLDNPGTYLGATPTFLTRGTEFGLGEPGVRTAGSIGLLSRALIEWRPYPFDRISLEALGHMIADIGAQFVACDRLLNQEMSDRQSRGRT